MCHTGNTPGPPGLPEGPGNLTAVVMARRPTVTDPRNHGLPHPSLAPVPRLARTSAPLRTLLGSDTPPARIRRRENAAVARDW